MPDQKPPRLAGDERQTLLAFLSYQRGSFIRKVQGVADDEAARPRVPSGTSLLWLTNHVADAEITWVMSRFARRDNSDFAAHADTIERAVARYRQVSDAVDGVIDSAPSLDVPCPPFDTERLVNLRWILAHLVEEIARHAGHADILRETIDGDTGR